MIYEKLPFSFDIEKLKLHLQEHVLPLPITNQADNFGGWSITSSDGDFRDGWNLKGREFVQKTQYDQSKDFVAQLKEQKIPTSFDFVKPTQICHGYFAEVIENIANKGLRPRRVRIIRLSAQSASTWHRDLPDHVYGVRLHIPIITNPGCFFECDDGKAHLPADGSAYLLRVNRMHRVSNDGDTHRYNMVMDITDKNQVSQYHRLTV